MNTLSQGRTGSDSAVLRAGLAYLVVGFAMFLLMAILGLLMRLNQGNILVLPPGVHYAILTLHGSGMVTAILVAALGGVTAILNRYLRLSARLLWIALFLFFMGTAFVILATLVGRFGAGWTILPPLPYEPQGSWSLWSTVAAYLGYLLVGVAFLLWCIEVLLRLVSAHGSLPKALAWPYLFSGGKRDTDRLPAPIELVAGVVAIDGIITVIGGVIILVPLFGQAAGLVGTINALFAKNFIYIFGHTLVNLTIYLAAGLVYATLPAYAGREWKTTWLVSLGVNLILVLVLLPYFHHLYQDFAQPMAIQVLGEASSFAVAFPAVLVTILGGMGLIYRSGMRWAVPSLLMALGLWGWTLGGIGAVLDAIIPVNQVMHNTLWVPAHFHTYYLIGAAVFVWGYLYHLTGELTGAPEGKRSTLAVWLYGFGSAGFVMTFFIAGGLGVPRRFAVFDPSWQVLAQVSIPFIVILGIGAGWLAVDVFRRLGSAWRNTYSQRTRE